MKNSKRTCVSFHRGDTAEHKGDRSRGKSLPLPSVAPETALAPWYPEESTILSSRHSRLHLGLLDKEWVDHCTLGVFCSGRQIGSDIQPGSQASGPPTQGY